MSRIPNDQFSNLNFSQLLGTTNPNQSSSSNPSTPSSQNSISSSSQIPFYPPQFNPFQQMTPEQIYFQQHFQLNQQFPQNLPETQFKVPQPQPPQKETRRKGKGKRMAKKSSTPAVNLDADEEDEDEVMMVQAPPPMKERWTRGEEMLLCEVWVGVSENPHLGNDRNEECFWGQIQEDFNKRTIGVHRTKNMITGKWNRMHPDCQKFHAIYKGITRKSGENDDDVLEAAKAEYSACNKGKKFVYEHGWRVLKLHPKWDAADHFDSEDHTEIFGLDSRPRPQGKPRPAKKTKSETTESSAGSGSGSMKDVLNEELRQKIQAGKSAYEAKRAKEQSATELQELQFLTIDAESLPEPQKTIIKKKQAQIMAKYQ